MKTKLLRNTRANKYNKKSLKDRGKKMKIFNKLFLKEERD